MQKNDLVVNLKDVSIEIEENALLSNVNLQMQSAEFCFLVGKTGCGKSTLLRSLYADIPLKKGKAEVLGVDLKQIRKKEIPQLRRQMGMIFQGFQLFPEWTAGRNLAYVLSVTGWREKDKIRRRIEEVLEDVGLSSKIKEKTYNLSGGEQQRLAIARALLNDPKLIIADEPTGNLDPDTSDLIIQLLREVAINNGSSVLMATHDLRIMEKYPSRVFRMENKVVREVL